MRGQSHQYFLCKIHQDMNKRNLVHSHFCSFSAETNIEYIV